MCQYCSYRYHDGWTQLLAYDDTYQTATTPDSESTYGFHDSYDDLREEIGFGR
jgi:hypothetical protein